MAPTPRLTWCSATRFWRTRFNADPRIMGTTVDLNKHPFTIIGVAAKGFNGTELFFWPDFWIPMVNGEQVDGFTAILDKRVQPRPQFVIGMLRPG